MAAPSFVKASAGTTDAGGAWAIPSDASDAVGNVWILHILQDGATDGAVAITGSTAGRVEDLAGVDDTWTQIPGPNGDGSFPIGGSSEARQHLYIGRALQAALSVQVSGTNSTSEDLYGRFYEFTDVNAGTTLADVIENATAGSTVNSVGTSATIADASVQTLGADRLALNFVAVNDDNAVDAFVGMTGGTWAEATAEYASATGTDGCIQFQTATMASAGTIDGGTLTMAASDAWGALGFALIPAGAVEVLPPKPVIVDFAVPRAYSY